MSARSALSKSASRSKIIGVVRLLIFVGYVESSTPEPGVSQKRIESSRNMRKFLADVFFLKGDVRKIF